jgi:hypothetical protein
MEKVIEIRRHYLKCNLAGFTYWDGCIALEHLKIGSKLRFVREINNKFDPNAIALYFKSFKLGYIPSRVNEQMSRFIDMGYNDMFEVRICRINKEAHTESQIDINIYILRNS